MPVAHLGHVELLVPDLDASTAFFRNMIGLEISDEQDGRVFLRAWQDFDHHTLVLTEASEPAMGHIGWRVPTKAQTEEIEHELEARGIETSWGDAGEGTGHGETLSFRSPGGIPIELYYEVEYYQAPNGLQSKFPSHPSLVSTRGAAARRFDHVTFSVNDAGAEQEFHTDALGIHHRYYVETAEGLRIGSWLSATNVSHETAFTFNGLGTGAHMHHVAYFVESPSDVLKAATFLSDRGVTMELGPANHATSGATCLYFREPSGHLVEIWTGGLMIFDPSWKPLRWDQDLAASIVDMWGTFPKAGFLSGSPVAGNTAAAGTGS